MVSHPDEVTQLIRTAAGGGLAGRRPSFSVLSRGPPGVEFGSGGGFTPVTGVRSPGPADGRGGSSAKWATSASNWAGNQRWYSPSAGLSEMQAEMEKLRDELMAPLSESE